MKQLLIDRTSITSEEFEVLKRENNVLFSQNEDIVICVIKIDNYYDFVKRFNEEDISVLKYGIINILTEIFNESFCAEIVDSKQDELTILMNIKAEERLYIQLIKEKLQRAQECILGYLRISISASISQSVRGIKSISKQYNIVLDNMAYRFVYGNLCVITMEIASRNNQNNFIDYTFECERRLLEEIKKGDMENSIDALLKLLSDISALDYSNITLSIMHLLNSLKKVFRRSSNAELSLTTAS